MNENQAKENQAKENQAFEKKIGSDGRYYMPYNWRKFFKPEILKQAETSHYTVSSISRGTYHLSGVVKISPKQSVEVFIHNMPHDITECNSSIGGYCQLWSCSNNCVHMAALLLAYEKQCGPFILKESDYAFRSRKEMEAKAAERKRREALAESLKGQTMTALDAIGGPLKSDGLIFYDLNRILRNCTVTAYSAKRYEEVCKDSEPDVKLEETVLRTGVKQLRCSMNTSDTLGYVSTQMIFESDRIYLYECTCSNHNGLCEHQLYLSAKAQAYAFQHTLTDLTDKAATLFFKSIQEANKPIAHQEAQPPQKAKVLECQPRIAMEDGEAKLSFKIGHRDSKLIIVRNLSDVYNAYQKNRDYELSKKESVHFATEDFTDESIPIFSLLMRRVREIRDVNEKLNAKSYYSAPSLTANYQQKLEGSVLDQFYDLADGMSCEYTDKSNNISSTITVGYRKMQFTLTLNRIGDANGTFAGVSVNGVVPVQLKGTTDLYLLNSTSLSRMTQEEVRALSPFRSVADAGGYFRFHVGLKHLQEFYYRILPGLIESDAVTLVDHCGEEAAAFLPPEPAFVFLCDYENDMLIIRSTVAYEERKYTLTNSPGKESGYHDLEQEKRVVDAIRQYAPQFDTNRQAFVTAMDEEQFFDFLREGIPFLSHYGEVSGTDAFRSHRIRPNPTITVGVSVQSGLMDLSISSKDMSNQELLALLDSYTKKKKYYRLKSGEYIDLEDCDELHELLELCGSMDMVPTDAIRGKLHLPMFRALYLDRMLEDHDSIVTTRDRTYRALIKNFKTVKDADYEVPASLENVLRPYQSFGFKWLSTVENAGFGGILADEMGLGKTIQIIAVLLAAKENGNRKPSLVVCPASLVYNWQEEFHRFAPALNVQTISGTQSARRDQLKAIADAASAAPVESAKTPSSTPAALPEGTPAPKRRGRPPKNRPADEKPVAAVAAADPVSTDGIADVYVTSYDLLKRDIASYENLHFFACVLDEAQFIKNQKAQTSKAVKILQADHRFALTGTPIENRLSELWSIFDFLMPGFLYSSSDFMDRFENPIAKNKDEAATTQLKRMVGPFILRRRKEDVLKDLPAKLEEVRYARFDKEQQNLYDAQVVHMRDMIHASKGTGEDKLKILAELTHIRQICCDPSLLFEDYHGESAKREACLDLIENAMDGGHRMLIFSQFTSMLALLEHDLNEKNIPYFKITGSTPKEARLSMVHQFNDGDTPVFLISLKAGGTGLNLTGADVVIHYDPWWNLAAQNQATDRAHRIGQTKQVTVFRLIVKGTIEEKILELQEAKKDLADAILEGRSESLMSLSNEELLALLS